ncbi:CRE-ADT-2 protein [Aphelenchoides besseyi]|nr:CRE-ADT-2 protein [Aphelenchoides besseyi]
MDKLRSSSRRPPQGFILTVVFAFLLVQPSISITQFFTADELRYTFGVGSLKEVPEYKEVYPQVIRDVDGRLKELVIDLDGKSHRFDFESSTSDLVAKKVTVVHRERNDGGGRLEFQQNESTEDCHFHHRSNASFGAISTCDGSLKGTLFNENGIYVLHPVPERHQARMKRSADGVGLHIVYKRNSIAPAEADFCGIENTITSEEMLEDEAGVNEDVFVTGQRLVQNGEELVVELAIFVDELLWRHFSSKYGGAAWQKLQQFAVTFLNQVQIMYKQPTAIPQLHFRIVRYEVFKTQPSAMAPHLHSHGHAQQYLDRFCRYQRSLGVRDWDHALLLTGYDIHRGSGSRSISGIARLDGMCDPWNTCTLAEGLDFTSAFIGTHELGHSVGMRHDEPYCSSTFIMSSSLGPGKVTWSTCSLRDYHSFIQRLDSRGKNCLRLSLLAEKVPLTDVIKPGQLYDANMQCMLMHGPGYIQIAPRQDHYDGICHMLWCGLGLNQYGRIVTSHPALEGTFCGPSKWCQLGRCVPWTGNSQPSLPVATTALPTPANPTRLDGQWSAWSTPSCTQCSCPQIIDAIGVTISRRTCTNPSPANGGQECGGSATRAVVCSRTCSQATLSVNQYISNTCAEHKRIKQDNELTGTGSQLTRYPQRACKVFCDVRSNAGSQRNYRFYGDNLPDGTSCGWDRYCLGGECLVSRYFWKTCIRLLNHAYWPPALMQHLTNNTNTLSADTNTEKSTTAPTPLIQTTTQPTESVVNNRVEDEKLEQLDRYFKALENMAKRDPNLELSCNNNHLVNRDVPCPTDSCPLTAPAVTSQGQWLVWSLWLVENGKHQINVLRSSCTVSCGGGGYKLRISQINVSVIQTKKIACGEQACPVIRRSEDWTDWTFWSACSVSCGRGSQARYRRCTTAQNTIAFSCPGKTMDIRNCDELPCAPPLPTTVGVWQSWSAWSACSTTCGPGVQTRDRLCSKEPCDGSGTQRMACNVKECSQTWNNWGQWSECSRLCGRGIRSRSRNCPWGATCPGSAVEQNYCNEQACTSTAANSLWSGWSEWSFCSVTCGNGIKRRTRACLRGDCPGQFRETAICSERDCINSNAQWGGWGLFSPLSSTCGVGFRRRIRKCYGSGQCIGEEFQREEVVQPPC